MIAIAMKKGEMRKIVVQVISYLIKIDSSRFIIEATVQFSPNQNSK